VVFSSSRDGNFELYSCDLKGQNLLRLTDQPRQDIRPRLSPDGQTIAFTSNRDGNYEIYTLPLTGGTATRVTTNPERDDYPAWTIAGEIVYVEELRGRFDIRRVAAPR
jgi:Tol biopolymer transport system component